MKKIVDDMNLDIPSLIGSAATFIFIKIGLITLNEYAVLIGIGVGVTTIGLNVVKFVNEWRRGKLIKDEIRDSDKET